MYFDVYTLEEWVISMGKTYLWVIYVTTKW